MEKLESEKVIVEAPLSFTGATKRIWRLTENENQKLRWFLLIPLTLVLLFFVYCFILCWYTVFGVFLLPYRLIRRSQRKNKRDELRHRELLAASKAQAE